MKNKFLQIIIHLICCLGFLALPILFAPDQPIYWFQFDSYAFHKLALYILFIGFFYLNFFVLLPNLYFSKRYILYFGACIICFFIITYTPELILPAGGFDLPQTTSLTTNYLRLPGNSARDSPRHASITIVFPRRQDLQPNRKGARLFLYSFDSDLRMRGLTSPATPPRAAAPMLPMPPVWPAISALDKGDRSACSCSPSKMCPR